MTAELPPFPAPSFGSQTAGLPASDDQSDLPPFRFFLRRHSGDRRRIDLQDQDVPRRQIPQGKVNRPALPSTRLEVKLVAIEQNALRTGDSMELQRQFLAAGV